MMLDFGVDPSERKGTRGSKGRNPFDQLTEEQKSQIEAKVKEMREAYTDHREIRKRMGTMVRRIWLGSPPEEERSQARLQG